MGADAGKVTAPFVPSAGQAPKKAVEIPPAMLNVMKVIHHMEI